MNNKILKRVILLAIILLGILGTTFVNANTIVFDGLPLEVEGYYENGERAYSYMNYEKTLNGRLLIEATNIHDYTTSKPGDKITLQDLKDFYDVLCCEHGRALPSINQTFLKNENGSLAFSYPDVNKTYIYDEDAGTGVRIDGKYGEEDEEWTNKSIARYVKTDAHICTPKEAYILAEMAEASEGHFFYDFEYDGDGNKVVYDGYLNAADSMTVGNETFYIIEKEYVTVLNDGTKVQVEASGTDANGNPVYKYKGYEQSNDFMIYDGVLEWGESKTGSGGSYAHFEANNPSGGEFSGQVGENPNGVVGNGHDIYITGSNAVVYDSETNQYYRVNFNSDYNYVQLAWWTTIYGGTGNSVSDTPFSKEAEAFEQYILEAADATSTAQLKHRQEKVIKEDGSEKTYDYAFDIKYEPKWVEDIGNLELGYDEDKDAFIVKGLQLNYIEASEQISYRDEVQFAGITEMELYTNISDSPMEYGTDWRFVWESGERAEDDDYEFPHSGEKFSIEIKNKDGLTKIVNIKTKFRYMNASGIVNALEGVYNIGYWKQVKKPAEEEGGSDEWYIKCYDVKEDNKAQQLCLGIEAARWYKYVELDRDLEIQHGKIRIYKELQDAEGERIKDSNAWFKVGVKVNGAANADLDDELWVRATSYVDSKVYYWLKENGAPTWEVTEVTSNEYFNRSAVKLISITPQNGTLENEGTVAVTILNEIKPYEGKLQIVKELHANNYLTQAAGGTFTFEVKIHTDSNKPFYVNGTKYSSDSVCTEIVEATVSVSSKNEIQTALSKEINVKWSGNKAPKYEVKEVATSNPNITLDRSVKTGIITKDTLVKTEAFVNEVATEKAKLHIVKKLQADDVSDILTIFTKEYIEKLEWKFTIAVDGYETSEVVLKTAKWQEDGSVVWEYTTDYYYWSKGETKNYTITEHDNPEGTVFSGVAEGSDGTAEGSSVKGTLKENKENEYKIINTIINKANNGKTTRIHITKNLETEKDVTEAKVFNFAVTLKGTFIYNGKLYKDARIQLTTDADGEHNDGDHVDKVEKGAVELKPEEDNNMYHFVNIKVDSSKVGEWTSEEIKWYGEEPEFKVEERLLGEDYEATIQPKEGKLKAGETGNFEIKAVNSDMAQKEGYLHIIKKIENADKLSEAYLGNLEFTFDVEVTGYPKSTITIPAESKGNEWVFEWTSPAYTWKASDPAPTYIVTEHENKEFNVLSTNPQTGTLKEATLKEIETNGGKLVTTDVEVVNQAVEHRGTLKIIKELENSEKIKDDGVAFTFDVEIKGNFLYNNTKYQSYSEEVTITLNSSTGEWTSNEIVWYGGEAPTYVVKEKKSEFAELKSLINATGTITDGETKAVVTAINTPIIYKGYIEISKVLENDIAGETFNDDFTFKIKVDGHEEETVTLKAGQSATFGPYEWPATSNAPSYEVTEINLPEGCSLVSITGDKGTLENGIDKPAKVKATNKYEEHSGNFKVIKAVIVDEKLLDILDISNLQFSISAKIEGTFKYNDEPLIKNGSKVVDFTLGPDGVFESGTVTWFGNNEPTVTVSENNLPLGWYNVGISNNGAIISTEGTTEIVVTNKIDIVNRMELTMELGGLVWEEWIDESSKNTNYSNPDGNGVYDADLDYQKAGVEVYVYDKNGNLVTLYNDTDKGEVKQPLITGSDGLWEGRLRLDKLQLGYYVEFVYDGQTYKTVKPLVSGDASSYKGANDKTPWENNSMAADKNRSEVNAKLSTIEGEAPISGNGNTIGAATNGNGDRNLLEYTSTSIENESARKISKLQTLNEDGTARDLYKTTASTAQVGLTYPFNKQISLVEVGGFTLTELGYEQYYKYTATQDYMKHINLGLVKRADVDMGVTKDLVSAKVVVKDRLMNYTFNGLADIVAGDENRVRTIQSQAMNLSYELGLYKTDYYYRAELYRVISANGYETLSEGFEAYNAVEQFYKQFGKLEDTEMDVYLTYKMNLYNETSQNYDILIHKLYDYYDSTFELVTEDVSKYITEIDNSKVDGHNEVVANKPENNWVTEDGIIKGSDGRSYKKMSLTEDINLSDGTPKELKVTFKVTKDTIDGVKDSIVLGTKSNVIEIASYTTKEKDGSIAGKADCDSAPDNVNIPEYNAKTWYEDDTDSAPELELKIEDGGTRSLSGMAWEDKKEDGSSNGNGIYDKGDEALIGGLTTELLEKVEVDGKEYDFLWPTSKPLTVFSGKSIEDVTGFDSTIETARKAIQNEDGETTVPVGGYEFTSVPAGNYIARFIYGNDKTKLVDTYGITGLAKALKEDGTSFSGDENNILTAGYHRNAGILDAITGKDKYNRVVEDVLALNNTDTYTEVNTPAIYNGQDYKSTIYKVGGEHDSDARDDEARRLAVIAESETITNINGTVLATANYVEGKHSELFDKYWMFADTEKYEMPTVVSEGDLVSKENGKFTTRYKKYEVKDVDLGLIERPENQIILDKEIKSIKLITNDNNVIFDAEYDISYNLKNSYNEDDIVLGMVGDKFNVAEATLNNTSVSTDLMQALDKEENKLLSENNTESIKNFRFINIDDSILQGTTIDIEYQLTAINAGEEDYTTAIYEELQGTDRKVKAKLFEDIEAIKQAKVNKSYTPGTYVSEFYYTGTPGANDVPVTTRIRQLVEYVDNDAVFTTSYNDETDHSWRNTTVTELTGNGYDNDRLLDLAVTQTYELIDINGMTYITDQRNNVILSEDSLANTDKNDLNARNNGFEKKLSIIGASNNIPDESMSDITLRVTRTIAAAKDTDDLTFDNLAEIVKFENTVGRREVASIPGNANPHLGEFETAIYETDSSATELITFTPPTGLEVETGMTLQVLLVIVAALGVVAVGVIIIKKKVL